MLFFLAINLFLGCVIAVPLEERNGVEPEFLDQLLAEKRYDEFNEYMDISIAHLSRPNQGSDKEDPSMNAELFEGDILLTPKQMEESRQGIRFDRYPGSRWPGQPAGVPYVISNQFSSNDRTVIQNSINEWNSRVQCIKFNRRSNERDYIMIYPGDGCWANLGRTGNEQSISLGNGCVYKGIVWHEMEHSIGIHHEHNRYDRDDYVEVLWENIPQRWRSQYEKNDPSVFGLQSNYDYYSIMHYRANAPETNRPAFRFKQDVDTRRVGQRQDFSPTDLEKMRQLYCN